jgi:selenocysteine-specific elongation factor
VLDPLPPKRRGDQADRLQALAGADQPQAALLMLREAGAVGIDGALLAARLGLEGAELVALVGPLADVLRFGRESPSYLASEAFAGLRQASFALVESHHAAHPLQPALPREELRRRVFARTPEGVFERVLESLADEGQLRLTSDSVARAGHQVRFNADEEQARVSLLGAATSAALAGLELAALSASSGLDRKLLERVARALLAEGTLERVGDDLLVHREALEALKHAVRERWPPGSRLDVAGLKEMTGLSRKWVIPLLEYLDRERVTRRAGADRLVLQ